MPDTEVVAADGRVIGERAHRTRRRLLDATARLLDERGALGLRVVEISRETDSSPATFYQYFTDVEEALLALADEATDELDAIRALLVPGWSGADGLVHARRLVEAFVAYRQRNRAILRLRDLRAEEDDGRFRAVRQRGYAGLMSDLMTKVDLAKAVGRLPMAMNSYAVAGAAVAMMERLVSYQPEFERRGVDRESMTETIALLLLNTVDGTLPGREFMAPSVTAP
jgi:AcrR family transcriptional regulator